MEVVKKLTTIALLRLESYVQPTFQLADYNYQVSTVSSAFFQKCLPPEKVLGIFVFGSSVIPFPCRE
jgi:hypothetical protein